MIGIVFGVITGIISLYLGWTAFQVSVTVLLTINTLNQMSGSLLHKYLDNQFKKIEASLSNLERKLDDIKVKSAVTTPDK